MEPSDDAKQERLEEMRPKRGLWACRKSFFIVGLLKASLRESR